MRRASGSSAICTTARSSVSWRWRSHCDSPRARSPPTRDRDVAPRRRPGRARRGARRPSRARTRHPSGHPHRPWPSGCARRARPARHRSPGARGHGAPAPAGSRSGGLLRGRRVLTNVAKYASASRGTRLASAENEHCVVVEVSDDGVGGASPAHGTGLRGLADRVAALDGALSVESPLGGGTCVTATIPLRPQ